MQKINVNGLENTAIYKGDGKPLFICVSSVPGRVLAVIPDGNMTLAKLMAIGFENAFFDSDHIDTRLMCYVCTYADKCNLYQPHSSQCLITIGDTSE